MWDLWLSDTPWAVALSSNVHGIDSVAFPDGDTPSVNISRGHPLHGLWIVD